MSSEVNTYIGRALRRQRRILGFTQDRLAQQLGVTHQLIQKYEAGAVTISAPKLYQVAKALGQPVASFFPLDEMVRP